MVVWAVPKSPQVCSKVFQQESASVGQGLAAQQSTPLTAVVVTPAVVVAAVVPVPAVVATLPPQLAGSSKTVSS